MNEQAAQIVDSYVIESRRVIEVNTDPQRRCYNGCHFSSELVWTSWDVLTPEIALAKVDGALAFWEDLNAYAVSQRGESAKREFRAVKCAGVAE